VYQIKGRNAANIDYKMTPLEYASRIAYSTKETLQFSYEMGQKYKLSDGIFTEFGVAAGAQVIAMLAGSEGHELWAFDSFIGIPLPSNRDDQMPGVKMLSEQEISVLPNPGLQLLETTGATSVSQGDFMAHVRAALPYYCYDSLIVFNGWFEETLPSIKHWEPIAILRLDGDLYNSTFVCLTHAFKHLMEGGVCIIDDWQLPGCRDACLDYFHSIKYVPKYQFISNIAYFFK
jgi:O-methyltransferase